LFLQAVMFGHGGLTSLGLNGLIIGGPALMAGGIYRLAGARLPGLAAAVAGAGAVALALALFAGILLAGLPTGIDAGAERAALAALALAHLPLMLAEGAIVVTVLAVLRRVEPGMLPRV
jgi:cobalt/nickel transport system permease protein